MKIMWWWSWRWSTKRSALIELSPLFSQSNLELVSSPASSKPCCVRVSCTLSAWKIWLLTTSCVLELDERVCWECCECYQHHDECATIGWKSVFHTKAMLISSPSRWHSWCSRSSNTACILVYHDDDDGFDQQMISKWSVNDHDQQTLPAFGLARISSEAVTVQQPEVYFL